MRLSSRGRLTALGLAAVALMGLLVTSQPALADHAAEMKAREAFAAGRYDQALEMFAQLYAETLHPVYLRNIGRCHQKMREPQKAIDAFQDYLAKEKKISPEERAEIQGYIKDMNALLEEQARQVPAPPPVAPIAAIAAPPPTAMPPAPAPPTTTTTTLVTQPGSTPQPESPVYTKWWFWTAIGVVAAGGVATALVLTHGGTIRPACPSDATGGCL